MTLSSVFDLAEEAWNFITPTTTDMLVVRTSRVSSSDAEKSATMTMTMIVRINHLKPMQRKISWM